ncbi:TM2 domain [Corynebacterium renale]|uniref:TM2 domain-containing protein n=1 Tax=Corynebacterium renale TaxID=1724 RepID=UPI000653DEA1|nr:TM2 domain-containing protein [Corynebacterium renale]SQG64039.1 TM2 domain [Corynebacterium renale]
MSNPNNSEEYLYNNPFDTPEPQQPRHQYQQFLQQPQQAQQANVPAQYLPQQPAYNVNGLPVEPKSKVVAALLALFLGPLGLHNFYLGFNDRGKTQLIMFGIGFVTSIFIIGLFILFAVGVWALVDFACILLGTSIYTSDARGLPIK